MARRLRTDSVAIAVDRDKASQYALKWAIDNLIGKDGTVKLVHVKYTSSIQTRGRNNIASLNHEANEVIRKMFLSFRCYCRLRQTECEIIVLENSNIANGIVEFVDRSMVEHLVLGAPTKYGLSRLFKVSDLPSNVMKNAPEFCNIYVISKGRVSSSKRAERVIQFVHGIPPNVRQNSTQESLDGKEVAFDEVSLNDFDVADEPERISTDSTFLSFYENFNSQNDENEPYVGCFNEDEGNSPRACDGHNDFDPDWDEEMKTLRLDLREMVEMHPLAAEQQARGNEIMGDPTNNSRIKEGKKRSKQSINDIRSTQTLVEMEKASYAAVEAKALELQSQSMYHIIIVILLLYIYFSNLL